MAGSPAVRCPMDSTERSLILYFNIIASAGATNASLVMLLVPASAIMLGAVFLGERLEPFELLGMALILSSLLIIDGRLFRRRGYSRWLS
jgi:drug/metabolite transporter (DMT)-like permease